MDFIAIVAAAVVAGVAAGTQTGVADVIASWFGRGRREAAARSENPETAHGGTGGPASSQPMLQVRGDACATPPSTARPSPDSRPSSNIHIAQMSNNTGVQLGGGDMTIHVSPSSTDIQES